MSQVSDTESIELVPKSSLGSRRYNSRRKALLRIGAVAVAVLVILAQLMLFDAITPETILDPATWKAIAEKVWEGIQRNPVEGSLFLVFAIVAPAAIWIIGEPRLVISANQIAKTGARRNEILGRNLNWSVKSTDIASIKLEDSAILSAGATLTITRRNGARETLQLAQWDDRTADRPSFLMRGIPLFPSPKRLREHNLELPLVKALRRFDYPIDAPRPYAENDPDSFDLLRSPMAAVSVALIFAMVLYTVIELINPRETYVAGYPMVLFLIVGIIIGAGVCSANIIGRVPQIVALGLGLLAAVAAGTAAYPGLLRINAGMDQVGIQSVQYVHQVGYEYRSLEGDWPNIEVPENVHWGRVDASQPISVPIRRGGLGFYQADIRDLVQRSGSGRLDR